MAKIKFLKFIFTCAMLGFAGFAYSAIGINEQIGYIAVLKNSSGSTLPDGSYDIVFRIYDSLSGGALLWTGNHTSGNGSPVQVVSGVVNVALGSGSGNAFPYALFQNDNLYLSIAVGSDPEMSPRLRITSAAQAINTKYLNGLSSNQFVRSDLPASLLALTVVGSASINTLSVPGYVTIGTTSALAALHVGSNSVVSQPIAYFSGNWFTGGSSNTTKPAVLVEPFGIQSSAWSMNGTGLGVNSAAGFTGNLIDLQVNGVPKFTVNASGKISLDPTLPFTVNTGGVDRLVISNTGTISLPFASPTILINGSQTLRLDDTLGRRLLEVKGLNQQFGGYAESGAFVNRNSYYSEEFTRERTNITADTDRVWGDASSLGTDESSNCTWSIVDDAVNGISRTSQAVSTNHTGCLLYLSETLGNAFSPFNVSNLPVVLMKARVNSNADSPANHRLVVGLTDSVTGSTDPNSAMLIDPSNGVYFRTSSTGTWQGVSASASAVSFVDCGVAVSSSQFALMKIETISSSLVKFYIDGDVSDGVNFSTCGELTTNIPTVALSMTFRSQATSATPTFDLDFFRVWQDDSVQVYDEKSNEASIDLVAQGSLVTSYDTLNDVSLGSIVSFKNDGFKKYITESTLSYDQDVAGVITEDKGLLLGVMHQSKYPVATFGRAMVKVRANADMGVGDYITSSEERGVGMKAVRSGFVIGRIMESMKKGEERLVLVNLSLGWQDVGSRYEITNVDPLNTSYKSSIATSFLINQRTSFDILQLQSNDANRFVFGNNGSFGVSADVEDGFVLQVANKGRDLLVITPKVTKIHNKVSFGIDTAGEVMVPAGKESSVVVFDSSYDKPPLIYLTIVDNVSVKASAFNVTKDGFEIKLDTPQSVDVFVNWFAVSK